MDCEFAIFMEGFGRDCKSMLNEPNPIKDKSQILQRIEKLQRIGYLYLLSDDGIIL